MFLRKDPVPPGLVKKWYETGSFPSGHTTKAMFFCLFLFQYGILTPIYFLIVLPLLIFRVIIGFHYPIDILGGVVIGFFVWFISSQLQMPPFFNQLIHDIFSFAFYFPLKIGI